MLGLIVPAAFGFALCLPGLYAGMLIGRRVRLHATGE